MPNSTWVVTVGLVVAACGLPADTLAQRNAPGGWLAPNYSPPPVTDANRKPAPRRSLTGTWIPFGRFGVATQAGGVQAKPNMASPENQASLHSVRPGTVQVHKALEGADAVRPPTATTPGSLRAARHAARQPYNLNVTQIFQDEYKSRSVAVRQPVRVIWTDCRELPKVSRRGRNRRRSAGTAVPGLLRRAGGWMTTRWKPDGGDDAGRSGLARCERPAESATSYASPKDSGAWTMTRWSGQRRSTTRSVCEPWGDHETPVATARSPHRHHGVLLFPGGQQNYNTFFGNPVSGK